MQRIYTLLILIPLSVALFGQEISPKVVTSSGDILNGSSSTLSWTLGEIATVTVGGNNFIISQGFHQPYYQDNFVEAVTDEFRIRAYPNPVTKILTVELIAKKSIVFRIQVVDILGNIRYDKQVVDSVLTFNMESYPDGIYFIRTLSSDNKIYQTIKITKQTS